VTGAAGEASASATGETDVTGDAGEAAATGETGKGETGETGATLMASTTLDPRTPNWPHMREDEALITQIGCEWRRMWMALITQFGCRWKRMWMEEDDVGVDGWEKMSESMGEAKRMEYGEKRERGLARHASYT
jgi:hypothetical protein